jgi:hypothetical protein
MPDSVVAKRERQTIICQAQQEQELTHDLTSFEGPFIRPLAAFTLVIPVDT